MDKIDCQSPRAELEIGGLRNPILTGRHEQRDYLAMAQMAEKALKHVNGVLLHARRGAFWKSVRQNVKSNVFHGQEQLFARGSFAVSVFRGLEANK